VGVVVGKRLSLRLRLLLLAALSHFSLLSFSHLLIVKWIVSMSARSQSLGEKGIQDVISNSVGASLIARWLTRLISRLL
jgi:hypothetical protein